MGDIYGSGLYLPAGWLAALARSDLRLAIYGVRSLYGTLVFLHLAGMGIFFGLVVLFNLRVLGYASAGTLQPMRPDLVRLMWASFIVTIASGVALFIYDPLGIGLHSMFLPKLILTGLGFAQALWLKRLAPLERSRRWRQGSAGAALAIWTLVIGCAAWNHAERPILPATILRLEEPTG